MKIISWNLLHRRGATLEQVEHLIHTEKPDLFLMQETTDRIDLLPSRIGGHYARHPLPDRVHGLAAWSPTAMHQPSASIKLQSGMIVERICQIIDLGTFSVANVHLSHGQLLNRRQLRRIAQNLPERAAVLGDCNLVGSPMLPGFRDVGPRQGTHAFGKLIPLRLDRCFVRGLDCVHASTLQRGTSDHSPIMVRLAIP